MSERELAKNTGFRDSRKLELHPLRLGVTSPHHHSLSALHTTAPRRRRHVYTTVFTLNAPPCSSSHSYIVVAKLLCSVHTFHCTFCSHLVVASTHTLSSVPRRRDPGLDHAYIFPLPTPSKSSPSSGDAGVSDSESSGSSEDESDDKHADPAAATESSTSTSTSRRLKRDKDSYTLLLTLVRDRAPKVITREDGFEKRYIWRCGRCKLVIGYQLDETHYELGPKSDTHGTGTVIVGGGDAGAGKDRARKEKERTKWRKWFYVLPGALTETEELGREPRKEVELVKLEG